jgi:ABC-2 type transport system ATP-binding protein
VSGIASPSTLTAGIMLSGLTKTFRSPGGPVHAVRGIDISIAPGETVALLGPNGAGKSTTIDMILGLHQPDSGEVRVFGMTPSEAIAAGAVGGMLQTGAVIKDLSVREIITMVASLYPKPLPVDEVMAMSGITDLDGRKTTRLSGGQTQRVRAAMALVSNPDLLVLDEPTVALDVSARHEFWTTMRTFASRGKTVLFATHYLEEADAYADRIILMARGSVVADGSANMIKASVNVKTIRAMEALRLPGHLAHLPRPDGRRRARPLERCRRGARLPDRARVRDLLSRRDVLVAARDGATVADIAGKLFLSEGTVRNYLSAAIAKTGVRNRVEAVRVADERG